ncbi:hypothetical protein QYF36_021683 [Acer negundo]|nr:hypothetical protein QYF36_021683 [Acer negundo]
MAATSFASPTLLVSSSALSPLSSSSRLPSILLALSVSLRLILGLLQAIFLIFRAKPLLKIMGVKSGSPMMASAIKYLTLRSLGAPAVRLSLTMFVWGVW